MEPIEFVTPNNYKAYIKARLTFGEYNQIRSAVRKQMLIEFNANVEDAKAAVKDVKIQPISLDSLSSTNEVAIKLLVTKITDAQGVDLGDPVTAIDNMPIEDGDAIYEKINEITAAAELSKKKGI